MSLNSKVTEEGVPCWLYFK